VNNNNCKGCQYSFILSNKEIEALVEEQLQFEQDLAPDEEYYRRLAVCKTCSNLTRNTTCLLCGCFVQFRARLSNKKCPHPNGDQWRKEINTEMSFI
jgi:hypothetical protein